MLTRIPRLGCILLVLTMGLSGCFSASLPADAVAPPLPPIAEIDSLNESYDSGGSAASQSESEREWCTFLSARQYTGEEREFKGWQEREEDPYTSNAGPRPTEPRNETVIVNVGDEDWLRVHVRAPDVAKRDNWTKYHQDFFNRYYNAFKVVAKSGSSYPEATLEIVEGITRMDAPFENVDENGLTFEVKVKAVRPGGSAIDVQFQWLSDDDNPEWHYCYTPFGQSYYVNPES